MSPHTNTRIGLLGVGRMGLPIAVNLTRAGYPVRVFDTADAARDRAASAEVAIATSASELVADNDLLITVLPGPEECRRAVLEALPFTREGAGWLDLTSNDPRAAATLATEAAASGISAVGAPMRGGPRDAEAGTLGFYVGGAAEAVARIRPVLRTLGREDLILHVGTGVGDGYVAKLLANTLWFGQVAAVTECLLLGQSLGLDLATLRDVLRNSPGSSVFLVEHLDALLAGDYLESFGIDRVVEELQTVVDLADAMRSPIELARSVAGLHEEALRRFGPVPGEMLGAKVLEERAGRALRME